VIGAFLHPGYISKQRFVDAGAKAFDGLVTAADQVVVVLGAGFFAWIKAVVSNYV
jgi:hypothetical protein